MKKKEIKAMDHVLLKGKLEELQKELIKENAQIATGTIPKSPGKLRNSKKTIARIKTILNEKNNKKGEEKK